MTQPALSGAQAHKHAETLSEEIGARVTGSDAARRAAEYVRSCFREIGLRVEEQAFPVETAEISEHSVEIVDPRSARSPPRRCC